uniref:Proteasome inhibitor PI31 subunit n=1 Tax=Mola mola TaxID=94237 RepID=A0A3Q4B479_MOLML
MTGLEVLYTYVASSIDCPQDAIVCFVHWEMIKSGYRCIGSGDEPSSSDKMTELLPADWSNNKELYSLRYKAKDTDKQLLLKAVVVSSTMIFNLMNSSTQQVSDLTVNIYDHLDTDQLHSFDRLVTLKSRKEELSNRIDKICLSFLDNFIINSFNFIYPLRSHSRGGMIVDPIRSGYPHSSFDPSSGIPDLLPPGAVPPGARFDPFGPIGLQRPEPDPDPMSQPGYDDMFI